MIVRWNFTSSFKRRKKQDIFIISIAKSGRTWLRVLVNKYFSEAYDIPFEIEDLSRYHRAVPAIFFTHELWEHYCNAKLYQKILGKYVIPDKLLQNRKVILMYRDPRDILVSLYFHKTKRDKKNIQMTLEGLMRDRRCGIRRIVQVLNLWRKRLENHRSCFWLSYEALRHQTQEVFSNVMTFIQGNGINTDLIRRSVEFAEFENMKKMEAAGEFKRKILKPSDPADPDSFKVREGKIGGYIQRFAVDAIDYLDSAVGALDPFYGYQTTGAENSGEQKNTQWKKDS